MSGATNEVSKKSFALLEEELNTALSDFNRAEAAEAAARREKTAALNRLNDAQKAFDLKVSQYRSAAPSGSDWKSKTVGDAA